MQYVTARTAHDIIPNLQFVKTLISKFLPIRGLIACRRYRALDSFPR
ncbi:hypothetical protein HanXRQr2_Chr10g0457721 [Helianthus annuus]|uniref:Uncharacterized protein n=1 Tax=Helianthus annuus TaxID=4232 RepID=A0A9K3I0H5_HELAN|nr:hypothetical protein HanXRQr2_Chr10g0457721 [Helianthus annuus]